MRIENPLDFNDILNNDNLVDVLGEQDLRAIGADVVDGYHEDYGTMEAWLTRIKITQQFARHEAQPKENPIVDNPANTMFPIISDAVMQFASRATPALVPSNGEIVKPKVVGADVDGGKRARSDRSATYLNFQFMQDIPDWYDSMDRLMHLLPLAPRLWKKVFFDTGTKKVNSMLLKADELIYDIEKDFNQKLDRKTHKMTFQTNDLLEKIRGGVFIASERFMDTLRQRQEGKSDELYTVLEQHCLYDMDGDSYEEPYIVTVDEDSKEVLRIRRRFESVQDGENNLYIQTNAKGEIVRIEPIEYFVPYEFIPAFDGTMRATGFNTFLAPMNDAVNSILNRLLDSATLYNTQGGFIAKGTGLKSGDVVIENGKWNRLDVGADIRQSVMPYPVKEPSQVLFALLGFMVEAARKVGSAGEILSGTSPGANASPSTVMALIEQGQSVFKGIYARIRRALGEEVKMVAKLNRIYLNPQTYYSVVDGDKAVMQSDFSGSGDDFILTADPTVLSNSERLMKLQAAMEVGRGMPGVVNMVELGKMAIEAIGIGDTERIFNVPPPAPDKALMLQLAVLENEKHLARIKEVEAETKHIKTMFEVEKIQAEILKTIAETEAVEAGSQLEIYKAQMMGLSKRISDTIAMHRASREMMGNNEEIAEGGMNGGNSRPNPGMAGTSGNEGGMGQPPGMGEGLEG